MTEKIVTDLGNRFLLIKKGVGFDDAVDECEKRGLVLAKITEEGDYIELQSRFDFRDPKLSSVWIGARRNLTLGDSVVDEPSSYFYTDTVLEAIENEFMFGVPNGEFPWANGEPNGQSNGEEACAEMFEGQRFKLNDNRCDKQNFVLCSEKTNLESDTPIPLVENEIVFIRDFKNFNQASRFCRSVGVELAPLRSKDDFEALSTAASNLAFTFSEVIDFGIWIGVKRSLEVPLSNLPSSFEGLDSAVEDEFVLGVDPGKDPWDEQHPTDEAGKDCVFMSAQSGFKLVNDFCNEEKFFVCFNFTDKEKPNDILATRMQVGGVIFLCMFIVLFLVYAVLLQKLLKLNREYKVHNLLSDSIK